MNIKITKEQTLKM